MVPVMDLGRGGEGFRGGLGSIGEKYGSEWDGSEGRVDMRKLRQFMMSVKQAAEDDEDDEEDNEGDEEEEMSEASPHKFA